MQLKDYQQDALDQLDRYLDALKKARFTKQDVENYPCVMMLMLPAGRHFA